MRLANLSSFNSRLLSAAAVAAASIAWAAVSHGGGPAPALEDQASVGYVHVPVVVHSSHGYVRDLRPKDFRLLVDGRPASFDSFETGATAPVRVVVLQDLSGSMANGGKLEASRRAIGYLLDQARADDEFALAWFAGDVFEIDVPFTSDLSAVREALATWEAYGTTALQDAVAWLPQITLGRSGVKRAAILITDGVDNASTIDADLAREIVRESELPVYVLGLGSGRLSTSGEEVYRFADMLGLLASLTGGRYQPLGAPEELEQACAKILEDLRHQYVLGFSTGGTGLARDHRLEVEVAGRGRRALAFRRGYHGFDPSPASATTTGR